MLYFNKSKFINKTVVGFNTGHHGGCAIIHNGRLVAISEERLNRKKNSDGYINSFIYCLNSLNLDVKDIDLFVSSSYHKRLPPHYMGQFRHLGISQNKFITVDHHYSHAFGGYEMSPFKEAIVLVIDGLGNESDTESYYVGKGKSLKKVGGNSPSRPAFKGIGRAYESFTNFLGWSAQEAGKTMGLAAHGKEVFPNVDLFSINKKCEIESYLNDKYHRGAIEFLKKNKINFGLPFQGYKNKDAAFFVQDRTEKVIIELVNRLYKKYKIKNLGLVGGVFLNSIINKKILDYTPIKEVFIPPCCDDTGQAVGNAVFGFCNIFNNPFDIKFKNAYLGREYSENEIIDVIEKKQEIYSLPYEVKSCEFIYKKIVNISRHAAKLLSEGNIIGWFQGASEIGPRALGHRSILSAPFPASIKKRLNRDIKHREDFRPFAPAVLDDKASKYFRLNCASPFMLLVAECNSKKIAEVAAALQIDGTGRVQTVSGDQGRFYQLIKEFYKITKIPVVLNTSFNDSGEPIVETPRDALNTFCKSKLDYLIIGDYLIWKK